MSISQSHLSKGNLAFLIEVTADNTAYSIAEIDDDRQCKMFGGSESSASESLGIAAW